MLFLQKTIAWFAGVYLLVAAFHAYGQEPMTRTHACKSMGDIKTLAEHLTTEGFEGYNALVRPLLESRECEVADVPAIPPPTPPLAVFEGEGYAVVVRPVSSRRGVFFALLIVGDARAIPSAAIPI